MRRLIFVLSLLFIICLNAISAQDPHFSQFFMAPQFINPAQMGQFEGDWRFMGNFRQQWGLAETPFTTAVGAYEMKFTGQEEGQNILAVGTAFMYDHSMFSAFKSNYVVANAGYHVFLNPNSSIGIGFHGMYANRRIDYSALTFGEQFTSINGFDAAALNGESTLTQPKPYFSLGSGVLYNYNNAMDFEFSAGASIFHVNKPKQSFLGDKDWVIPMRYVAHSELNYQINQNLVMNLNGIFQYQSKPSYFSVGGALGMDISGGYGTSLFYAGGWFREGDAFYPYVGLEVGKVQLGFTYDITHSKQIQGPSIPQTFEMSFIIRGEPEDEQIQRISCPWR
jgi:hypothetical protein